jgi:hypothetical protein
MAMSLIVVALFFDNDADERRLPSHTSEPPLKAHWSLFVSQLNDTGVETNNPYHKGSNECIET